MLASLLGILGTLGIAFGIFGFVLAGSLFCGGADAVDIRGNACRLLVAGAALLVVAVANTA
jgi:hypothetical protein